MTTLDDILNLSILEPEIENTLSLETELENDCLFTIDKTYDTRPNEIMHSNNIIDIHRNNANNANKPVFAYQDKYIIIRYTDSSKVYNSSKTLGKYVLKQHQLTTLYYMRGLEKHIYNVNTTYNTTFNTYKTYNSTHYTNIGILGDAVGAGKSYCIMCLLNEQKSLTHAEIPFRNIHIGSSDITQKKINKLDTNILLVPHSLIGQWSNYLKDSGLKYHVVKNSKDIYSLGDNTCKLKSYNGNLDGNDGNDDDAKQKKSKPVKKQTKKEKEKENEEKDKKEKENEEKDKKEKANENDNEKEIAISDSKPIKKRIIAKKQSISISIETPIPEPEILVPEPNKEKKPTKLILKAQNIEISNKLRFLRCKLNDISISRNVYSRPNSYDAINNVSHDLKKEIETLREDISVLEKQKQDIDNEIELLDIANGTISSAEINLINTYYTKLHKIVSSNPDYDSDTLGCYGDGMNNYISDYLKLFLEYFGHINKSYVESLDVILVSDTFYNLFSLYINRDNYTVNRLIIDECNSIKGSNIVEVKNIFSWFITSSIGSLMTNTGYIYNKHSTSVFTSRERSIMSTGYINDTVSHIYNNHSTNSNIFLINNPEYIKKSILLPEMITIIVVCKDNTIIQVLNGIVAPDILNMLNAGDIEGIITKLDVVCGDEKNIISIITQKYRDELLLKEYELKVIIEKPNYNAKLSNVSVINKENMISELKHKIDCIEKRVINVENCPICLDDFVNPAITPCCNNKFCFNCITLTLNSKSNCPTCRASLVIDKLLIVSIKSKDDIIKSKNSGNGSGNGSSSGNGSGNEFFDKALSYNANINILKTKSIEYSKYDNLNYIFELNATKPNKKYLIFTEYESTLNTKITSILDKWNLTYGRIRGSSVTITKQIENYKNASGGTNVLLVNSKFFGSGMNLENTTDIIILHKMHRDIEMQAIGRAQRFGRENSLRVWKLYYENETLSL